MAEYDAGKTVLDQLLEAQRFWANALSQEYLSIRDYNNALATFEFAKGTILARNNIVISEGMLPGFPQKRAVEHIAERNAALPIRERPNPIELSASAAHAGDLSHTTMESEAPSLPTMMGMAHAAEGRPDAAADLGDAQAGGRYVGPGFDHSDDDLDRNLEPPHGAEGRGPLAAAAHVAGVGVRCRPDAHAGWAGPGQSVCSTADPHAPSVGSVPETDRYCRRNQGAAVRKDRRAPGCLTSLDCAQPLEMAGGARKQ